MVELAGPLSRLLDPLVDYAKHHRGHGHGHDVVGFFLRVLGPAGFWEVEASDCFLTHSRPVVQNSTEQSKSHIEKLQLEYVVIRTVVSSAGNLCTVVFVI